MASEKNITAQVIGGQAKVLNDHDVETVKDAFDALGLSGSYTATVNGDAASFDERVDEYSFITFSPAVKGGY